MWGQAPVKSQKKENFNIQIKASISNNQYSKRKFQYPKRNQKSKIKDIK